MNLIVDQEAAARAAADLHSLGFINDAELELVARTFRVFRHGRPDRDNIRQAPGTRELMVTVRTQRYSLDDAHAHWFGIRDWRTVVVSIQGQNEARLAEQRRLGRQLDPGERSSVPLPDWYELAHLIYEHPAELGLDPTRPVYQYLPAQDEEHVNFAEALHLRQPR